MCTCVPLCAILFIFLVVIVLFSRTTCCSLVAATISWHVCYAWNSFSMRKLMLIFHIVWSICSYMCHGLDVNFFLSVCDYCHGLYSHIWAALDFFGPYVINMEWHWGKLWYSASFLSRVKVSFCCPVNCYLTAIGWNWHWGKSWKFWWHWGKNENFDGSEWIRVNFCGTELAQAERQTLLLGLRRRAGLI